MDSFENYRGENFHMSYSVFSKIAIIECLGKLSKSHLNQIKEKYLSKGLWEISIHHDSVVIFYTRETEIEINNKIGVTEDIENKIKDLTNQYDEFNYLKEEFIFFGYDSKENFIKKYKGNWHDYYR